MVKLLPCLHPSELIAMQFFWKKTEKRNPKKLNNMSFVSRDDEWSQQIRDKEAEGMDKCKDCTSHVSIFLITLLEIHYLNLKSAHED